MGIVYQTDKRSGITYAYENQSFWDPVLKRSKSKRKLIGRVDPETKEIIPTDGRCKKLSPSYVPEKDEYVMPKTIKELKDEVRRLLDENRKLKSEIEFLKSQKKIQVYSMTLKEAYYKQKDELHAAQREICKLNKELEASRKGVATEGTFQKQLSQIRGLKNKVSEITRISDRYKTLYQSEQATPQLHKLS